MAKADGDSALDAWSLTACFSADGRVDAGEVSRELEAALSSVEAEAEAAATAAEAGPSEHLRALSEAVEQNLASHLHLQRDGRRDALVRTCTPVMDRLRGTRMRAAEFTAMVASWREDWQRVRSSWWSRPALEGFLDSWPDLPFAPEAQAQLTEVAARERELEDRTHAALHGPDAQRPEACMALRQVLADSPLPQASERASPALVACDGIEESDRRLVFWEQEALTEDAARSIDEIAALAARGTTDALRRRAGLEMERRYSHLFECSPLEGSSPLDPGDWPFAAIYGEPGVGVVEGFLPPGTQVDVIARCDALPLPLELRESGAETWLFRHGDVVGALVRINQPLRQHLATGVVRSLLGDVEPCELWQFEDSSNTTPWIGDHHSLEMVVAPPKLELHVGLFKDDYAGLAAGVANLFSAGLGSRERASKSGVHDQELIKVAMCLVHQTQAAYMDGRFEGPEPRPVEGAPEGLPLMDAPLDAKTLREVYAAAASPPRQLRLEITLYQPTEVVDGHGVRSPGKPKRLRTGLLVLNDDQLMRNDWASIAALVDESAPMLHPQNAAATLRRFCTSWSTW